MIALRIAKSRGYACKEQSYGSMGILILAIGIAYIVFAYSSAMQLHKYDGSRAVLEWSRVVQNASVNACGPVCTSELCPIYPLTYYMPASMRNMHIYMDTVHCVNSDDGCGALGVVLQAIPYGGKPFVNGDYTHFVKIWHKRTHTFHAHNLLSKEHFIMCS